MSPVVVALLYTLRSPRALNQFVRQALVIPLTVVVLDVGGQEPEVDASLEARSRKNE